MTIENYVYKKEVDWSLLNEGLTLPFDNQVVFGQIMGRCEKYSLTDKKYDSLTYGIGSKLNCRERL